MQTIDTIVDFLASNELLSAESVVNGSFSASLAARRNYNIIVAQSPLGFLIKQSDPSSQDGKFRTANEAAFCRLCHSEPALEPLRKHVPQLVHYESLGTLLVQELIPHATPLWSALYSPPGSNATLLSQQLGKILGTFHRQSSTLLDSDSFAWLERALPWILSVNRPHPSMLATMSIAHINTLRIIQSETRWVEALDKVRSEWLVDSMIHADVKSDNVLVRLTPDGESPFSMWIVDWETVQYGDSIWDVAGVLQDFILFWVHSMPVSAQLTANQMIAHAQIPLHSLQACMRSFWHGYKSRCGMQSEARAKKLKLALRYAACRLIQSAFESSQQGTALSGHAILLLQVSANILDDPESSQLTLFGIPEIPGGEGR
jgi:hypothetical protein